MKKVFWKKMMKMIVIILLTGIIIGFGTGAKKNTFVEKMNIIAKELPETNECSGLNGGDANIDRNKDYENDLVTPNDLKKTGYLFAEGNPEVQSTMTERNVTFEAQGEELYISPESISVNQSINIPYAGETAKIETVISPESANTETGLTYTSSNTDIARVNEEGIIRALKKGTCTITVTTENGKTASVECSIESGIRNELKAIQAVADAYYARGKYIQYNSAKAHLDNMYFGPEEATEQNRNYIVCSGLTRDVYEETLGIVIPRTTAKLLEYGSKYLNHSEVITYGCKLKEENGSLFLNNQQIVDLDNDGKDDIYGFNMEEFRKDDQNNYNEEIFQSVYFSKIKKVNPQLYDILPYLQIRRCTYLYWSHNLNI